ncbi:hypothetical protein IVA79_26865 [Bradyrhizobium sp. 138]|uniref:hypothetical protein n=1 Tax=Bradyrhizobium sp. 138 TaxID=2782615 RepID=UPI001FF98E0C|nr:hypothetical protein [Bradyrhizobium sp. 138]MCK1737505.1 hypothetical protein [Bradyrhizobium sp. 138]
MTANISGHGAIIGQIVRRVEPQHCGQDFGIDGDMAVTAPSELHRDVGKPLSLNESLLISESDKSLKAG